MIISEHLSFFKDLEDLVNNTGEDGFIIVSFVSIAKSSSMPDEIRKVFINTFYRLKQQVLWKWEDEDDGDVLSNNKTRIYSNNVKLLPWIPQQDLPGHPRRLACSSLMKGY